MADKMPDFWEGEMVGVGRIELPTPAMSTQCSTTELYAHIFPQYGCNPFWKKLSNPVISDMQVKNQRQDMKIRDIFSILWDAANQPISLLKSYGTAAVKNLVHFHHQIFEVKGLGQNPCLRGGFFRF